MVCLAPRAREYSVRPRRSSGASVRPLNFTVRRRMKRPRLFWRIVPWLAVPGLFISFFEWIPWLASQPIAEAPPNVAALMPPGCPAVFANHGQYTCFWPGLIRDHPFEFALMTGALFGCVGILIVAERIRRGRSGDRGDV